MKRSAALVGLAVATAPSAASAHLVGVEFGDFYAGALHVLSAPAHVAALVALGLVAARQDLAAARPALAALPLGFAIGVASALILGFGAEGAALDAALGLSLLFLGLAAALALRVAAAFMAAAAFALGALHGYANGLPAASGSVDPWLYGAGVVACGGVAGTLLVAIASRGAGLAPWSPLAFRVAGSWVAAIGAVWAAFSAAA